MPERVRIAADLVSAETGHHLWWDHTTWLSPTFSMSRNSWRNIAAVIEPELARLEREAAGR